jgi:hypothetical protein
MSDHPITPPPELVQQWRTAMTDAVFEGWKNPEREKHLCVVAAQWGADQELEACCGLLVQQGFDLVDYLHAARRPKPPSLKEQALDELYISFDRGYLKKEAADTIRRALEQLDD